MYYWLVILKKGQLEIIVTFHIPLCTSVFTPMKDKRIFKILDKRYITPSLKKRDFKENGNDRKYVSQVHLHSTMLPATLYVPTSYCFLSTSYFYRPQRDFSPQLREAQNSLLFKPRTKVFLRQNMQYNHLVQRRFQME